MDERATHQEDSHRQSTLRALGRVALAGSVFGAALLTFFLMQPTYRQYRILDLLGAPEAPVFQNPFVLGAGLGVALLFIGCIVLQRAGESDQEDGRP